MEFSAYSLIREMKLTDFRRTVSIAARLHYMKRGTCLMYCCPTAITHTA